MKVEKLECLSIWSENPEALAQWYFKLFNEKESLRLNEPDDTGVGFEVNGLLIWFGFHSEVTGKSKDPFRYILEFRVDDLNAMYNRLKEMNAEIIREPEFAKTVDCYVITAADIDGNTIQFLGNSYL
jgi:uncharacterized glyoxalase superfamily protein PhnB